MSEEKKIPVNEVSDGVATNPALVKATKLVVDEKQQRRAEKALIEVKKQAEVPPFAPSDIYVVHLKPKQVLRNLPVGGEILN